jgi:hypothetical protein
MSMIKIRHPRLKNVELSLADGLVTIDAEGLLTGDLSAAQIAKASLMGWEIEDKPKPKRRRPSRKIASSDKEE